MNPLNSQKYARECDNSVIIKIINKDSYDRCKIQSYNTLVLHQLFRINYIKIINENFQIILHYKLVSHAVFKTIVEDFVAE